MNFFLLYSLLIINSNIFDFSTYIEIIKNNDDVKKKFEEYFNLYKKKHIIFCIFSNIIMFKR